MSEDHAVERDGAETFRALEVAFLGRSQQRVQDLDRRLEHFHEFEQALIREAQATGVAVRIGIILSVLFELADVDLTDQRRDVLIVFVTRLGLGNTDLPQDRRVTTDDAELADVAVIFMQPFDSPRAEDALQIAAWNAVLLFKDRTVFVVVEQTERRFVDRRALDCIERYALHELLQTFRDRRLATANRAKQIQNLLLFFEPLGRVPEVRDHLLDHVFHSVELTECGVYLDDLVREDTRRARIVASVDLFGFSDCRQHAFASCSVRGGIVFAEREILLERELIFSRFLEAGRETAVDIHATSSPKSRPMSCAAR